MDPIVSNSGLIKQNLESDLTVNNSDGLTRIALGSIFRGDPLSLNNGGNFEAIESHEFSIENNLISQQSSEYISSDEEVFSLVNEENPRFNSLNEKTADELQANDEKLEAMERLLMSQLEEGLEDENEALDLEKSPLEPLVLEENVIYDVSNQNRQEVPSFTVMDIASEESIRDVMPAIEEKIGHLTSEILELENVEDVMQADDIEMSTILAKMEKNPENISVEVDGQVKLALDVTEEESSKVKVIFNKSEDGRSVDIISSNSKDRNRTEVRMSDGQLLPVRSVFIATPDQMVVVRNTIEKAVEKYRLNELTKGIEKEKEREVTDSQVIDRGIHNPMKEVSLKTSKEENGLLPLILDRALWSSVSRKRAEERRLDERRAEARDAEKFDNRRADQNKYIQKDSLRGEILKQNALLFARKMEDVRRVQK